MRIRWAVICAVVCCCCAMSLKAIDVASLKAKAEAGDAKAQVALAKVYESGQGVSQSDELAANWYMAAAQSGDAQAQNEIGVYYRRGVGVPVDKPGAVSWYHKAARQGYAPAMFNLGTAYYNGDGVDINDSLAYAWFAVADLNGSKEAAEAIQRMESELSELRLVGGKLLEAELLDRGEQVPARPEVALDILRKLVDAGNNMSRVILADMYARGRGVERSPQVALDLCERAAKQKFPPALTCMAHLYDSDALGTPDYAKAATWYDKAAKVFDVESMVRLGVMYRDGTGVKKEPARAFMYFSLAVSRGAKAKPELNALAAQLSEKEKKNAEKLRQQWLYGFSR